MRDMIFAIVFGLGVLAIALWMAWILLTVSLQSFDSQLHNPYWPFTVEVSVKDK